MNRMIRKPYIAALAVLALISVVLAGGALAKYVSENQIGPNLVDPQDFFFTTNFEEGGSYLFPAGEDFEFYVRNHNNVGNANAQNITYTFTLKLGEEVKQTGTGTLTAFWDGEKWDEKANMHIINGSNLVAGNAYLVEITSTAPYAKTISFTVNAVSGTVGNTYSVKDHGNWVQLDLYIGTTPPASVVVQYGENMLAPDNLNELMTAWTLSGTGTLTDLQPYTHYSLIFFGTTEVTEVTNATLAGTVTLPVPTP